ncbi:MAG: phosphoglycerate dehydrogenase [Clostridiales bacterium]|jgi:D-3-phosphoglycerate dehydrogenase|nr:phosphoglycerate dehydrogenase [Clostridiales bacterium]
MKILVSATTFSREITPEAWEALERFATDIVVNPYDRPLTENELIELLEGVDGFIAGVDNISAEVIAHAPDSLKVISRYGVGYDQVDIKACGQRGIIVTNTPEVNAESVADLAFGLMLSVARKIVLADRQTRQGGWPKTTGIELYNKTLGIIGLGAIGKRVARRAKGFSMKVLAYDPWIDESYCEQHQITISSFEDILSCSDFISLHMPLTADTRHIINSETINRMKDGVILINTARGGLIDEQAVYSALKSGKLGGFGLDVFEVEPPGSSLFFELDNTVVTPHMASSTNEAINGMGKQAVQNLIDVLTGKECPYIVNREYLRR